MDKCGICFREFSNKDLEKECCIMVCENCSFKHHTCGSCKKEVPYTLQKIVKWQLEREWLTYLNHINCEKKEFGVTPQEVAINIQDVMMLGWLEKYGLTDTDKRKTMNNAINTRNLEIISYLKHNGYPFDWQTPLQLMDDFPSIGLEDANAILNIY